MGQPIKPLLGDRLPASFTPIFLDFLSTHEFKVARYDTIIVGSGFGGSFCARELIAAGQRVLMVERGGWMPRGSAAADDHYGFFQLTTGYGTETSYAVEQDGKREEQGICACVGGPSVFYGGASFRFRESDFDPPPEIVGESEGGEWPFGYSELEPWYGRVEEVLGVAGSDEGDPTAPPRSRDYPRAAPGLSPTATRIDRAARSLGLSPSRIPLAIDFRGDRGAACTRCTTCDGFACHVSAKQDLATAVIPDLIQRGMELWTDAVVTGLVTERGRVARLEGMDRRTGERFEARGDRFVLAAGALGSPHLLLASGLEARSPAPQAVGRYLTRHCNAFVYGVFLPGPNPGGEHHKQVAILDFYHGDPNARNGLGKLGSLQQVMGPLAGAPLRGFPRARSLRWVAAVAAAALRPPLRHLTGLLAIAEDQPRRANGIEIDRSRTDRFGLPRAHVRHHYSRRDIAARDALVSRARSILKRAGARATLRVNVETFSHAVGTVRMGDDPAASPLTPDCRYRGLENLYVVDGSTLPSSGGVNPSLTIAAIAARAGERIARGAA